MKTTKLWLTTIAALLYSITASASSIEIEGIWYNLVSKAQQAEVTRNPNIAEYEASYSASSINIPATVTYDGIVYNVTSIERCTFYNCRSLTSIAIPDGVTSIGNEAFSGCCCLTSITIPGSVTSIGLYCFSNCSSLTSITIPDGVTSNGHGAFYNCSSLTSITLSKSMTSIGEYAFVGCSSLTSVIIPESVTSIGNGVFENCSSLISITIPGNVTSIGNYAFDNCVNLEEVILEDGNATLTLGYNSSNNNGQGLLYDCPLEKVYIGRNLSYDTSNKCYSPFYGKSTLASLTIGDGVTNVENYAFYGCSSLTSIALSDGVTSIGDDAFYGCSSLNAVHISSIEAWCKIVFEGFGSNPLSYAHNLYLNEELVTNLVIPEGITSVGNYVFYSFSNLTSITIPESVTSIGNGAFRDCSNLTSIIIPEGVTSIGDDAFYGCSSLTSITLPKSVTGIGSHAFWDCSNLTSIILPEGITRIENWAFYGCHSLTYIVLPKSISYVGIEAFANCSELTDVYCNAEVVPTTNTNAFDGSYIEYATLHVRPGDIERYKFIPPWSGFGAIVALTHEEMGIDNLECRTQDSELIHNLQGYRVANPAKCGVYIINGKKVFIK